MKVEPVIHFPCYCDHFASNLILWIFVGVFVILSGLSFCKFFREKAKGISKWLIHRPIPVIAISVLLLILVAFFFESNGDGLFKNSNVLSILSIVGIIGTIIGVLLTYEQLKIAEDRIDGYESFYKEVNKLLNKKDSRILQFYGPTLIPGHIVYNHDKDINNYRYLFQKNIQSLSKEKQNKTDLILYSHDQNILAYNQYRNCSVGKVKIDEIIIKSKIDELDKFQNILNILVPGSITLIDDSGKVNLIDNFYFSNGDTVIYAVPLHYQVALSKENKDKAKSSKGGEKMTPQLIGFKTTKRSIVQAFELEFYKLKNNLKNDEMTQLHIQHKLSQEDILKKMYSKHLVNVSYLSKICENKGQNIFQIQNPTELFELDQDHFYGQLATQKCIELLNINKKDTVLDIGSGFGGSSRYIAHNTEAKVTGVEIQKDRFDFSVQFTKSVRMDNQINFVHGDFNEIKLQEKSYSKCIAFLSLLHIIDKKEAIRRISEVLQRNGMVYFEDYYLSRFITDKESEKLLETISCPGLLFKDEYILELGKNNISIVNVEDMTEKWKKLAKERYEQSKNQFEKNKEMCGLESAINAMDFAKGVFDLFDCGVINGFRLIGKKK